MNTYERIDSLWRKVKDPAASDAEKEEAAKMARRLMGQDQRHKKRTPKEKKFVKGMYIKPPNSDAPPWVLFGVNIKRAELLDWLTDQSDSWINAQVCQSKTGGWYVEVNQWDDGPIIEEDD
tara:strand:- start:843 stop:1205 length:363 start_codon:yes stop_codon:yes gene_type:complete